MKKYLILQQTAPFQSSLALEKQELAFALASFNQTVAFLFSAEGVLQLITQNPPKNCKDFTRAYAGAHLFEIHDLFVDRKAADKYNIREKIQIPVTYVDDITTLQQQYDIVL